MWPAIAIESEILAKTILTLSAPALRRYQPARPSQLAAADLRKRSYSQSGAAEHPRSFKISLAQHVASTIARALKMGIGMV